MSPAQQSEKTTLARNLMGVVTSDKMNKSIVVSIQRQVRHEKYGKIIKRTTKVHAHDEKNECKVGDVVIVRECRPISKTKSWTLVEIKEKASELGTEQVG